MNDFDSFIRKSSLWDTSMKSIGLRFNDVVVEIILSGIPKYDKKSCILVFMLSERLTMKNSLWKIIEKAVAWNEFAITYLAFKINDRNSNGPTKEKSLSAYLPAVLERMYIGRLVCSLSFSATFLIFELLSQSYTKI